MPTCIECKQTKPREQFTNDKRRKYGHASYCLVCNRDRINRRNRALRVKVLTHYSGGGPPTCACCGETILEFLALDHINGGGRQHRKTIKIRWWEWLRKHGFPEGFRVLCHNCNQAIGVYGKCPHQGPISILKDAYESYDEFAPNKSYKLTPEMVREIKTEIANGTAQNVLAGRYRVSRATICEINKGNHWAHA